jgi:hypothetical protein
MTRGYTTSWIDYSATQPRRSAGLSRLENDSMSVFESVAIFLRWAERLRRGRDAGQGDEDLRHADFPGGPVNGH